MTPARSSWRSQRADALEPPSGSRGPRADLRICGLPAGQADVVAASEARADVLFVAPTGSGKSIAYWVPGIAGGGLTIVVSR